jgi:hypothetical protein
LQCSTIDPSKSKSKSGSLSKRSPCSDFDSDSDFYKHGSSVSGEASLGIAAPRHD